MKSVPLAILFLLVAMFTQSRQAKLEPAPIAPTVKVAVATVPQPPYCKAGCTGRNHSY